MEAVAPKQITPLRRQRMSVGLSLTGLAEAMGVTAVTASEWETGRKKPDQGKHAKLAKVLKVNLPTLVNLIYPSGAEVEPSKPEAVAQ
jgi:DNA-binding transcriptional regulator YiaG